MGQVGVDDVDGTVEQIGAQGGRTVMLAHDVDTSGRTAMVAGPQGARLALVGTL